MSCHLSLRFSDATAFSSMQDTRPSTNCLRLAIERKPFEGVVPVSEAVAQAPQVQAAAQETQPQLQVGVQTGAKIIKHKV